MATRGLIHFFRDMEKKIGLGCLLALFQKKPSIFNFSVMDGSR